MNSRVSQLWIRNSLKSFLFLVAFGTVADAGAQTWVVGGSVGAAEQQDYAIGGTVTNRDDVDTAFGVFGGYMIKEHQIVVASFVDFGTPSYSGPAFGGFTDALDADGFDISYVAGWAPNDQERISIFGSLGVLSWDQDVRYTDTSGTFEYHDEGTSFSLGFGADFNLEADGSSPWSVHATYKLFKDVGDADNSGHELDRALLSFGIAYRFGDRD
ncbi:MAG: hypothetical protein PVH89_03645 [Gammaproteobacteria bacterium]